MDHSERWSLVISSPKQTDTGRLQREKKEAARKTVNLMDQSFDVSEFRDLCMDFNISYENLLGMTKRDKIKAFVEFFERRNTLDVLLNWLTGVRPNTEWPDFEQKNHLSTEGKNAGDKKSD